jgi:hypothetical protein
MLEVKRIVCKRSTGKQADCRSRPCSALSEHFLSDYIAEVLFLPYGTVSVTSRSFFISQRPQPLELVAPTSWVWTLVWPRTERAKRLGAHLSNVRLAAAIRHALNLLAYRHLVRDLAVHSGRETSSRTLVSIVKPSRGGCCCLFGIIPPCVSSKHYHY